MKKIHPELFNEMKRTSSLIVAGWLMTRKDGVQKGYTSHDQGFTNGGQYFSPTNSFSGSASVSKNNLSVDNMTVLALCGDDITDTDLRNGVYDNAKIELFWCRPDKPEWGRMDIQGGTLGEIKIKGQEYEAELRSATQKLQQPFGRIYTTECDTHFGSPQCGVKVEVETWAASTPYAATVDGDALIGSMVAPTVPNGFWYEATNGTQTQSSSADFDSLPPLFKAIFQRQMDTQTDRYANMPEFIKGPWGQLAWVIATRFGSITAMGQGIVADPPLNIKWGTSGATEPAWPTTAGATVTDGQITWRAVRARKIEGTVYSTFNRGRFESTELGVMPDRFFQYGVIEWTSGANRGFSMEVRQHRSGIRANFDLLEAMPFPILPGDEFIARAGCAKTRSSCKAFNNLYNFQGFPDMPTEDKALASPNYSSQGEQKKDSGKK